MIEYEYAFWQNAINNLTEGSKSSHLPAISFSSAHKSRGNTEEITLPVQESGQTQCSETTALGATCFPPCFLHFLWCEEWLLKKIWQHVAPLCKYRHRLKTPTNSSGHGVLNPCCLIHQGLAQLHFAAATPCQAAWAFKAQWSCQLHTTHQRPVIWWSNGFQVPQTLVFQYV